MSPPVRRSRPTATNGEPAQIVDTTPTSTTVRRRYDTDNDGALFDVVVDRDAYGSKTAYVPSAEMGHVLEADDWWRTTARQDVLAWLETHETVSSDDAALRDLIPEPVNPNAWGALFSAMAKAGELEFVAYRKSRRRPAHSRIVSVWGRSR